MKKITCVIAVILIWGESLNAQYGKFMTPEMYLRFYVKNFTQIFFHKVISKKENVFKAFHKTLVETVPVSFLEQSALELFDTNTGVPAQVLYQKVLDMKYLSMANKPVFTKEIFTRWTVPFLMFELEMHATQNPKFRFNPGSLISPLNIMSQQLFTRRSRKFNLKNSLTTGTFAFGKAPYYWVLGSGGRVALGRY